MIKLSKKTKNSKFLAKALMMSITTLASSAASSAMANDNVIKSSYLYQDIDMTNIARERLRNKNLMTDIGHILTIPAHLPTQLTQHTSGMVNNFESKGLAIAAVNFSNSHWASLVLKKAADGKIIAYYNDPLGSAMTTELNNAIKSLGANIQIVDLKIKQQNDGTSCGAFTIETLIQMANADMNISEAEIRTLVASINNSNAIRESHFKTLGGVVKPAHRVFTSEEKEAINKASSELASKISKDNTNFEDAAKDILSKDASDKNEESKANAVQVRGLAANVIASSKEGDSEDDRKNIIERNKKAFDVMTSAKADSSVIEAAYDILLSEDNNVSKQIKKDFAKAASNPNVFSIISPVINNAIATRFIHVAAGDENASSSIKHGAWIKGLFGASTKNATGEESGYNGRSYGATIGADAEFNDDFVLGAAVSFVRSNFTFKGDSSGDKITADSKVFSIYSQKDITDNIFTSGIVSVLKSDTKIKTAKTVNANTATAKAKTSSVGVNAVAKIHYSHVLENGVNITPFVGISYARNADASYSEAGTGIFDLNVSAKKSSSFSGKIGSQLALNPMISDNLKVTPIFEVSVDQALFSKADKVKTKPVGTNNITESKSKEAKTAVNVGVSLSGDYKNINLTAAYETTIKQKFQSHQGSLKLRLNF